MSSGDPASGFKETMEELKGVAKQKKLMRTAGILACIFSKIRDVAAVGLTGSLARRENANDIDLVVLHKGNNDKLVFTAHFHPDGNHKLSELDRLWAKGLVKCLCHICEEIGVKADVFFVHNKVLTDCDYLQSLKDLKNHTDPDFYRTIFSEIPFRLYNQEKHAFANAIVYHKAGQCQDCKPSKTWQEKKEQGELEGSGGDSCSAL